MVLRCLWYMSAPFSYPPSHYLIWDGCQVPPRTPRLINHPRFNICPAPIGCPRPPPHPLWRWVLGFIPLSASIHTPQRHPFPDWQKVYCPMPKWRRDPLFPSLTKDVWSQDGTASRDAWDPAGVPPSPFLLFSRPLLHPSLLSLSFYTFSSPLLWGHSLSSHPTLFTVLNSQALIKTSSDSSERKQPDLAEKDIRHGCQWPFCMLFVHLDVVEIDKQS